MREVTTSAAKTSAALLFAAVTLVLGTTTSCCLFVRPPDARELLATGFRTPEQTLRTFQVGWRADEPDLELRCFSSGFRARNQLSKLTYREFRDRLVAAQPFLRLGIADAELDGPPERRGDRMFARATTHGRTLEFELVRDEFVEAWAGGERVADSYAPFADHHTIETLPEGGRRFWGYAALPPGADAEQLTELRVGREWKIDELRVRE